MTNLFVDGLDPLHVGDRVLRVIPVLRIAAPQFVNERLQLIAISVYIAVDIREGEVMKPQGCSRGPPEIPILLLRPLPHSPTLAFRTFNGDIVIQPGTREII